MKRLITLHSENLFFLFLFALLIIGFLCSSVTAENGPSPLVTPGSVSGLGTIAVVNSPVPVANGGTGKTTAAEALAALGGASLNGSSTVDFSARTLTVASFSYFGEFSPGVKMKVIASFTPAVENGQTALIHGLTGTKIIGWSCGVESSAGISIPPGYTEVAEYQYEVLRAPNGFTLDLHATNSGSILSKPVTIMLWYVE